jgi:hypothetical protein
MRYQPAIGVVAFLVLSLREEGYISLELFAECSDERACKTAVDGTFPLRQVPIAGSLGVKTSANASAQTDKARELVGPIDERSRPATGFAFSLSPRSWRHLRTYSLTSTKAFV